MIQTTDFLVIGAGSAGLACALELAPLGQVTVLAKDHLELSASDWAQGGIAAVVDPEHDSVDQHLADTLRAGAGLCEEDRVRQILAAGPEAIQRLLAWGVNFDREQGHWQLTREGGHGIRRVLHYADRTGWQITRALLQQAQGQERIRLLAHTFVGELILQQGRCVGAWMQGTDGQWQALGARAVILATGGLGQLFRHTSNPAVATGDGLALAWRAGAPLVDVEFVQFHPTTLYSPGEPAFLLSEALRGEGGKLRLPNGERFLERYDARAELAPRDIVSQAIIQELKERNLPFVELDMRHSSTELLASHFPTISAHCRARGYDLSRQTVPVVPAAHYSCGGIWVDSHGQSTIPGLYAIGEVAWTGLHGANRLASNSLLECIVGAHSAALHLHGLASLPKRPRLDHQVRARKTFQVPQGVDRLRQDLQELLWDKMGILRRQAEMQVARRQIQAWQEQSPWPAEALPASRADWEWQSLLQVAELLSCGALERQESRGAHHDLDFPGQKEPRHLLQCRNWSAPQARNVGQPSASDATADDPAESRPGP